MLHQITTCNRCCKATIIAWSAKTKSNTYLRRLGICHAILHPSIKNENRIRIFGVEDKSFFSKFFIAQIQN